MFPFLVLSSASLDDVYFSSFYTFAKPLIPRALLRTKPIAPNDPLPLPCELVQRAGGNAYMMILLDSSTWEASERYTIACPRDEARLSQSLRHPELCSCHFLPQSNVRSLTPSVHMLQYPSPHPDRTCRHSCNQALGSAENIFLHSP